MIKELERIPDFREQLRAGVESPLLETMSQLLDRHVWPGSRVLDAGSRGGSYVLRAFSNRAKVIVGVDVDIPRSAQRARGGSRRNIILLKGNLEDLPLRDGSFDVAFSFNVFEHLRDPPRVFAELSRVLVPGGKLIFKTPRLYNPVVLTFRALPLSVHRFLKSRLLGEKEEDVFPTYYRCNATDSLDRMLSDAGFERELLETVDVTYHYLRFSRFARAAGRLYSRAAGLPLLRWLRNGIIGVYAKC